MSKKRPSNRLNVGERGTQEAPGRKRGCVFESEVKFSGIMGRERESESERERDIHWERVEYETGSTPGQKSLW